MLTPWPAAAGAFLVGAVIGSFLNVVIYRLPRGESIVSPPSRCPHCRAPIVPWQNIPLVSWFLLGGKCRRCGGPISLRYPLVEGVNGLLYVLCVLHFGLGLQALAGAAFCSALLAVTGIDLDHQIIPDAITLPGMIFGLAASSFLPVSLPESAAALLAGGGFFYLVAAVSDRLLGKPGMGGGDIKLTAMMGSFLGPASLAVAVFAALLSGSLVSVVLMALGRKNRKDVIPFGPFLALGGVTALFWGARVLDWYFSLSGIR